MASKKPFVIPFPQRQPQKKAASEDGGNITNNKKKDRLFPNKINHSNGANFVNNNNNNNNNKKLAVTAKKWWWDDMTVEDHQDDEGNWFDSIPTIFKSHNASFDSYVPSSIDLGKISLAVEGAYKAAVSEVAKQNRGKNSGDKNWVNDVIKSGTLSDKIAAMALKIQESPFYSLDILDELLGISCKKDQRAAQHALDALKDLLVNNLLPDEKLRPFSKQPLLHPNMNMNTAVLLWYESQLKLRLGKLYGALEVGLKCNQDYFKRICMEVVKDLLIGKPEEEARLLAMLVNKLGDPSGNSCAKTIEHLKQVIKVHPAMKLVIVREVRQFLSRPDMKLRSIYNGVIFLSSLNLTSGDQAVATQLVQCYMGLFHKALKEDETGSRLLSALLTGVNRGLPYLSSTESLSSHVDALFLVVHTSSFSSATQALILLSHIALKTAPSSGKREKGDVGNKPLHATDVDLAKRFYRALYARLLSDQVTIHSKNTAFLNLLYRSIKGDPNERRAMAFLKRLSICAAQSTPPIAAGLLFLISEILTHRPALLHVLTEPEGGNLSGEESSGDKNSGSSDDESASSSSDDNDSDDDGTKEESRNNRVSKKVSSSSSSSATISLYGNFDVAKREPEFAVPESVQGPTLWEASLLNMHFHPSIQAFAQALLQSDAHRIEFQGDPLVEFNLISFLNRFAYKNPKSSMSEKIKRSQASIKEDPINVRSFVQSESEAVGPDKLFFHKYFNERDALRSMGRSRDRSRKSNQGDSDDEDGEQDGGLDDSDGEGDGTGVGHDNEDDNDDDEEEEAAMDRFANKLAEKMMRDHEAQNFPDDDLDGLSSDHGSEDDASDDDDAALDFADFVNSSKTKKTKGEDPAAHKTSLLKNLKKHTQSDSDEDGDNDNDNDADAASDGSSNDEYGDLEAYNSEEEEEEENENEDEDEEEDKDEDEDEDEEEIDDFAHLLEVGSDSEEEEDDDEEESSEEEEMYDSRGRKIASRNGKKKSRRNDDDDFADAADYEAEMEEIIQKHAVGGTGGVVDDSDGEEDEEEEKEEKEGNKKGKRGHRGGDLSLKTGQKKRSSNRERDSNMGISKKARKGDKHL